MLIVEMTSADASSVKIDYREMTVVLKDSIEGPTRIAWEAYFG
jgi:hypothetical protein